MRKSKNQIAYVVKKYSLGYDNKYIDFIACIDRKSSSQDIIQTLGRGLRSDNLGDLGKNRDKELLVLIPIFIEQTDNKFELEYLTKTKIKTYTHPNYTKNIIILTQPNYTEKINTLTHPNYTKTVNTLTHPNYKKKINPLTHTTYTKSTI